MGNNSQKLMFENPQYWENNRLFELENKRLLATKQFIPSDVQSILDVGCGDGRLTNTLFYPKVVGVDKSFLVLRKVRKNVVSSDILSLPFNDCSFDIVIASEVIEHLPPAIYSKSLLEIARLSKRYILITVPYKENIIASQVICRQCNCIFHPSFHMRRFEKDQLEKLFEHSKNKILVKKINAIVGVDTYFPLTQIQRLLRKPSAMPELSICPQCGYHEPPASLKESPNRYSKFLKAIWPMKMPIPQWFIALYEKSNFR